MKLPAIRLSRLWPFLVWCVVGVILFWPVRGYYVALPAPDSPPFFPAAYRLRYVEQFLAGNTALSPHHLFSLLLPPLVHHDLIYLVDTLLIAAGVAYLLRGRGMPSAAAWIGGGILAFAGYSFTLISAGHVGFFHMTVYTTFMFGFLVRALRGDGWPYYALTGLVGAWAILFGPDLGFVFLLLAAAYGLWLLLRNAGRQPWNARLRPLALGIPVAAICFLLGAGSTLRIILTEHLQKREQQIAATAPRSPATDAAPAADAAGDPQARWIFATNWSLHPEEIVEFVAPCLFGTQSGDPQAPYWGKLGRTLGWEQHRQGFANFRQHAIYLGGLQLLLAAFAIGCWVRRRQSAVGSQQSAVPVGSAGPATGSVDLSPAQANLEIRKAGRGAISSENSCFPAFQIQEERRGANEPTAPASGAPSDPWLTDVPFWAGVWVVGLLLAFGRHAPVYRLFYSLPYMSLLRAPVKFIRLVELATAVLAASGLACLMQPGARRLRGWVIGAGICAGLALLAALWAGGADAAIRQALEPMGLAPAAALLKGNLVRALLHGACACGVAAALFFLRGRLRHSVLPLLVLAAAWLALDALLVNRRFIMAGDLTPHYRTNRIVKQILQEGGPAPVVANFASPHVQEDWFSWSLTAHGVTHCVPSPQAPPTDLSRQLQEQLRPDPLRFMELCGARHAVVPLQAARALAGPRLKPLSTLQLANGDVRDGGDPSRASVLAQVPQAMPYAWLTPAWSVVTEDDSLQAVAARADARRTIVVGQTPAECGSPEASAGTVSILRVRHQGGALKTVLDVEAPTGQFLVLRSHAQASAKVTVARLDGQPVPFQRANHLWIGLPVPAGRHRLEFFVARDLAACGLNSLPVLLLLGLVAGVALARVRTAHEPPL